MYICLESFDSATGNAWMSCSLAFVSTLISVCDSCGYATMSLMANVFTAVLRIPYLRPWGDVFPVKRMPRKWRCWWMQHCWKWAALSMFHFSSANLPDPGAAGWAAIAINLRCPLQQIHSNIKCWLVQPNTIRSAYGLTKHLHNSSMFFFLFLFYQILCFRHSPVEFFCILFTIFKTLSASFFLSPSNVPGRISIARAACSTLHA